MTTSLSLADALLRHTIGFNMPLAFYETKYPPYNIEKLEDDQYCVTMAVAGFTEQDIDLKVHKGNLIITGSIAQSDEKSDRNYLYNGLAFRNFTQTFKIGNGVNVTAASLENGLLKVLLRHEVPEEEKPKLIPLTKQKQLK